MDGHESDAVQIYLTQMSSTSLLSRQQEIDTAGRIERSRRRLRQALLSSEYVLHAAVGMLEKVLCGRMRLETTCESWCLSQEPQKRRLVAALAANVHTLRYLVARNRDDFLVAVSRRYPLAQRRQARRRLMLRRAKAVRLIEESPVRRPFLQVVLDKLREISRRMDMATAELAVLRIRPIRRGARKLLRNCDA